MKNFSHRACSFCLAVLVFLACRPVCANPTGGTVSQGSATFNTSGSTLTIDAANNTFINWQNFNIGAGETTTFVQPSWSSIVWNQINDPNPSQILGNLNANGFVILQNASGFYVGGDAAISAHGLIMTTAPIPSPNFSGGSPWAFTAPPPMAKIVNYGRINISGGGSAFLIANDIENNGTISAPGGNIGLYAGEKVLVSTSPDGRGLSAEMTVPKGIVNNQGQLIADAGNIILNAKTINQNGFIQANSVQNVNGTIQLIASDSVNLGANSTILAQGDSTGVSSGGTVTIRAKNNFSDQSGSTINISGGAQGGNGGQVEISAAQMGSVQSSILGGAADGFSGGVLTFDPANVWLSLLSSDPAAPSGYTVISVSSFSGLSQINVQADNDIESDAAWTLANSASAATLTLTAGNSITFDSGSDIAAGQNWNVNMTATSGGVYLNGSSYIQTRNGDINVTAGGDVTVGTGAIRTIGFGSTVAGGNITVTAGGNVNTGTSTSGFNYLATAPYCAPFTISGFGANQHFNYNVSTLGGISTANGGNVTITASGNVTSYLPTGTGATTDAGTGAFGLLPGNVTITAGGNVYGHYVAADGTGTITANGNIGTSSANVALSLVNGSWTLDALDGSIYLQEVRNPNGVFNTTGTTGTGGNHYFNYSPTASVDLEALNGGVYLTGQDLPRSSDAVVAGVNYLPILLPPSLSIESDGLTLENNFTLFPSAFGNLTINDTGDFSNGNPGGTPTTLLMSDSGLTHWFIANSGAQPFSSDDYGSSPIEANNPNPVVINVGGNMEDVVLRMSKATELTVDGNMDGCSLYAQNLHANDVTSITVGGQIYNPGSFNFISLADALPNLPLEDLPPGTLNTWYSILELAVNPSELPSQSLASIDPSQLALYVNNARLLPSIDPTAFLAYDPSTKTLTAIGPMPLNIQQAMESQSLTFVRYGANGYPLLDSSGHFVTDTVSWASIADASLVASLATTSQSAPALGNAGGGYVVGGSGEFDVTANSISLGNSYGILSLGNGQLVGANYSYLTSLLQNAPGATINVTVANDQMVNGSMVSSLYMPSSTIAALGGGDVNVVSTAGSMDLGSQDLLPFEAEIMRNDNLGLGIYTTGGGNVNVTALGTINIDSSRIATFNGGNIFVESLTGDVNAGSGSPVVVPINVFSPYTTLPREPFEPAYANGIAAQILNDASAVPYSATQPGNITVLTPEGSIYADLGGISQEILNSTLGSDQTITLEAGTPNPAGDWTSTLPPLYTGNIDLGTLGVFGINVLAEATGTIDGRVVIGQNNVNLVGKIGPIVVVSRHVTVKDLTPPPVSNGGGGSQNNNQGPTIIGISVNYQGGQPATLIGPNVSANGQNSQSTLAATTASSASQSASVAATAQANQQVAGNSDDNKKEKKKNPLLQRIKRVTVLLAEAVFGAKS